MCLLTTPNVVFTSDPIWDGNEVASLGLLSLDFLGLDLVVTNNFFTEGKGFMDMTVFALMWCNCCVES